MSKAIWGVPSLHFMIYIILFGLSLVFMSCIFIPCETWRSLLSSIGTGLFVTSLVGYFIDLSNNRLNKENIKRIREYQLKDIEAFFKHYIERFINMSFRIVTEVYEDYDKNKFYKFYIKDFKKNIKILFDKYDFNRCGNTNWKGLKSCALGNYMETARKPTAPLKRLIDKLIKKDYFSLLNYYSNDEIESLESISNYFESLLGNNLEDFYQDFETITDKMPKILGIENFDNYVFYFNERQSGLFDDKNQYVRGSIKRIKDGAIQIFQ